MSKLDTLAEIFAANPEMADKSNAEIAAAFDAVTGLEVSGETIRKARKAFAENSQQDNETNDEPEDDETVDEVVYTDETGEPVETERPSYDEPIEDLEDEDDREDSPEAAAEARTETEAVEVVGDVTGEEPQPAPEPEPEVIVFAHEPVEGRCNHEMKRAKDLCGRPLGHPGGHVTVAQMAKKKAFSKARAKVRYHSDPAYADKIKKASRDSHKKARVAAKAAKEAAEAAAKADSEETPAPGAEVEQHDAA